MSCSAGARATVWCRCASAAEWGARGALGGRGAPQTAALENKDWALTRRLLRQLGELGFLGAEVPEAYGGLELDKITSLAVTDALGPASSFAGSGGGAR